MGTQDSVRQIQEGLVSGSFLRALHYFVLQNVLVQVLKRLGVDWSPSDVEVLLLDEAKELYDSISE